MSQSYDSSNTQQPGANALERRTGLEPGFAEGQNLVHGRFEVIKELGRGADGVVFLVQDRLRRMRVVLKSFWRPRQEGDLNAQESRESFRMLTRLQHPCLPILLDWGHDERGRVYFTKSYVEGTPGDKVAGRLTPEQVATLAHRLGETLALLHRTQYCHGDLKPHNMLVRQGEYGQMEATLIDFGLIFRLDHKLSGVRGTPRYMAPELLLGEPPSELTDIYALGATLYHLLYGVAPYAPLDASSTTGHSQEHSILRDATQDAELIDHILHDEPDHPPIGWTSPQDEGSRSAVRALSPLLQDLMSRDPRHRIAAFQSMSGALAPWAPPTPEESSGVFVGRQREVKKLSDWFEFSLGAAASVKPSLLLRGQRGVGKRRLLQLLLGEVREQGALILEHTPLDGNTDTVLEDFTRQLLISAPDKLSGQQTDLLGELALGQAQEDDVGSGEQERRLRLMRNLLQVGRQGAQIALVIQDLTPTHPALETALLITNHLVADRTRDLEARSKISLVVVCHGEEDQEEAQEGPTLATLRQRCQVVTLGPLDERETREFVHSALPPQAQPRNLKLLWELTGGSPLRLRQVTRYLLDASRRGLPPSEEVMREASDVEESLRRRVSHLSQASQAVLSALGHLRQPLARMHLQKLLPDFMLTPSLFQTLVREGLVVELRAGTAVLGQSHRAFQLSDEVTGEVARGLCGESLPPASLIFQSFVKLLREVEAEYPNSVEPLELLRWMHAAQLWGELVQRGPRVGQQYKKRYYHKMAGQCWSMTLEAMERHQPPEAERAEHERRQRQLSVSYLELLLELDQPQEILERAQRLLQELLEGQEGGPALYETLQQPPPPIEELLEWPWPQHTATLLQDKAPPSPMEEHLAARLMLVQFQAQVQSGHKAQAIRLCWYTMELMKHSPPPGRMWVGLLRGLAQITWRTSLRDTVVALTRRLLAAPERLQEMTLDMRVGMLNLYGALLETMGEASTAELLAHYERATREAYTTKRPPPSVARAITNMVRLFVWSGELQVGRYYARQGLRMVEDAPPSLSYGLLRSLADIYQRSGQPYAGLQTSEEAYRTAISSGHKALEARAALSLLHHYGEFGLKDYTTRLYKQLARDPRYSDSWEPRIQYIQQLLSWEDLEEADALLRESMEALPESTLIGAIEPMVQLLQARLCLLKARSDQGESQQLYQQALRFAGQAQILSRERFEKAIQAYTLRALAEAHLGLGALGEAQHRLDRLEEVIREHDLRQEWPHALYLRARVEVAHGHRGEGSRLFLRARDRMMELIGDMPQAYKEGYLKNVARQRIMEAAEQHDITERGHLIEGMRQVMSMVHLLLRRPDRRATETLSEVLDQLIKFTSAERGILFRLLEVPTEGEVLPEDARQDEAATLIVQDWQGPGDTRRWRVSVSVARGFGQQDLDNRRAKASRTVIRRILEHGQAVYSADTTADVRFSQSGSIANMGMRSILALPLRIDDAINGVVYLDSPYGQQFSDTEKELLDVLGSQLGPVVEVAHQREHVQVVSETFPRIMGRSPNLLEVLNAAHRVAPTDVSVLILGETGTGKDLLARGLHEASPRVHHPFVAVNCAALPESLIESELFGHVRGAFTGADRDKPGLFEQAHKGTLFLDEIGDLPLAAQAKLLRVLQEGTVRRVGDKRDHHVDVRVLTATHWNLEQLSKEKKFREDLYYRLNVITLRLPPLRERPADIPLLVRYFFGVFSEQFDLSMPPPSPELVRAMQNFPWPGNIRQLKNALQQAMLMSGQPELTLEAIKSAAGAVEDDKEAAARLARVARLGAPGQEIAALEVTPQAAPQPPSWPTAATRPPWSAPWTPWWPSIQQASMQQVSMQQVSMQQVPMQQVPMQQVPMQQVPVRYGQAAQSWGHPQQPQGWAAPWQAVPAPWQGQHGHGAYPGANGGYTGGYTYPAVTYPEPPPATSYVEAKARHRYGLALEALERAQGNKSEAARLMGISRRSFYRILDEYKNRQP